MQIPCIPRIGALSSGLASYLVRNRGQQFLPFGVGLDDTRELFFSGLLAVRTELNNGHHARRLGTAACGRCAPRILQRPECKRSACTRRGDQEGTAARALTICIFSILFHKAMPLFPWTV